MGRATRSPCHGRGPNRGVRAPALDGIADALVAVRRLWIVGFATATAARCMKGQLGQLLDSCHYQVRRWLRAWARTVNEGWGSRLSEANHRRMRSQRLPGSPWAQRRVFRQGWHRLAACAPISRLRRWTAPTPRPTVPSPRWRCQTPCQLTALVRASRARTWPASLPAHLAGLLNEPLLEDVQSPTRWGTIERSKSRNALVIWNSSLPNGVVVLLSALCSRV